MAFYCPEVVVSYAATTNQGDADFSAGDGRIVVHEYSGFYLEKSHLQPEHGETGVGCLMPVVQTFDIG